MAPVSGTSLIDTISSERRTTLSEHESKELLRAYGIPVAREKEIHHERELKEALAEVGLPAVIKACGWNIRHKTERGLVHTDIRNEREALSAFRSVVNEGTTDDGSVLVQQMVNGSRELVVGFTSDPQFGPCVMFGLGGVFTEILGDVSFGVAPLGTNEALRMIDQLKHRRILEAVRGMPAANITRIAEIITIVGRIGVEQPAITEIDINPIILSSSGPVAVDALIILKS